MADSATSPKLFISYSWTTPDHETWVLDLATQLVESGVDVILDKWQLKEGQDSYKFMEQMVTDPEVTKVIIVSDPTYASKADARKGGVGAETQIISPEIYNSTEQTKFVAIIPERDENGIAQVPTFFKNRIHIDFSDASKFIESFDQLLRWIYNKPVYVRPPVGSPPSFLVDDNQVRLGTEVSFRRCLDAIRNTKPSAPGTTDEYLNDMISGLEKFRLEQRSGVEFDDLVFKSIEDFRPYRDQFIQILIAITQYAPTMEYVHKLHRFFEQLLPFMNRPEEITSWRRDQFDNFRFVVHEAFLYGLTVLIDAERFELADYLLKTPYYIPYNADTGRSAVVDFKSFYSQVMSLEARNQRLQTRRYSLRADMLNERSKSSGYPFRSIMQADFIGFLRGRRNPDSLGYWWPETLVYSIRSYGAFEKFARSSSTSYFTRFKTLLGFQTADEFRQFCDMLNAQQRGVPQWQFDRVDIVGLSGASEMASRP